MISLCICTASCRSSFETVGRTASESGDEDKLTKKLLVVEVFLVTPSEKAVYVERHKKKQSVDCETCTGCMKSKDSCGYGRTSVTNGGFCKGCAELLRFVRVLLLDANYFANL